LKFLGEIEEGMRGRYKGLETSMSRLSKFINGIQKRTYYAIGAQPKSGKTSLLDEFFVLGPYLRNKDVNIKWIYFSPEVDLLEKMAKYTAYLMDYKYKVYCDSNYILSRGDNRLTPEHKVFVDEIAQNELKDLFGDGKVPGKIKFIEDRMNPEGIRQALLTHANENGKFLYDNYEKEGQWHKKIASYEENDNSLYTLPIVDHVGLVPLERGFSKKENIDKLSSHMVWFRNICNFSPVLVSQFNRDLGKIDRLKFSGEQLSPTLEDFKDTGSLSEDASLVLGIFNPTQHKHLQRHLQYDLNAIGKSYRSIHVLASRNTEAGVSISALLEGKTGKFTELPKPDDQNALNKVYEYVERKTIR